MRVLETFGEPISNGGQESFVRELISHMDRDGMTVDLLTPYYCDNDAYREAAASWGGTVLELGETFNPGGSRFGIVRPLMKILRSRPYDVVHVHSGSISILCIFAVCARRCGVKRVLVHSHCGVEKVTLKNVVLRTLGSLVLRRTADEFCACSKEAADAKFVPALCGKPVRILKNGVDRARFAFSEEARNRIRGELGLPDHAILLGHVGRFSYQKNHEYLVRVFAAVRKERPDAHLVLIGTGETEDTVRAQAADAGLGGAVHFTGTVPNVEDYLSAMDVFVLPSRFEGLPLVGVEAEAAGLPVVTSDQVSRELDLCPNVTFLPLTEDVSPWADAVRNAAGIRNPGASDDLGKQGFAIEQTAAEVRKLYVSR